MIIGQNLGFIKQDYLISNLNNKKINQLEKNYLYLIQSIFHEKKFTNEEIVKCKKIGGNEKPDLSISIKDITKNCSYKTGKSISVHQEKLETFIEFSKTLKATENEINAIKFYIWGDGTYDGSGKKNQRKEKWQIIRKDINTLTILKNFFYLNRIEIINRILNIGRYSIKTDFLIKQKEKNNFFIVKSIVEILSMFKEFKMCGKFGLKGIHFQCWNRSLQGQEIKPRDVIQFKWSSIEDDLEQNE
jgi:hypothetical protein